MSNYRRIRFGVEHVAPGDIARHIHREAYVNVVLAGHFTEAAFAGRFRAEPGIALIHAPFDCHANIEGSHHGPTIIRLPWKGGSIEGAYRVRDPDLLARLSERDLVEAEIALREMIEPIQPAADTWPDRLASGMTSGQVGELRTWAEQQGLNPASLSRGFRDAYQVSPQRFRLEARTRLAWMRILREPVSLTQIAHECAFADLAHMSRSIAAMTGFSPIEWRRSRRWPTQPQTKADYS